MLDTRHKFLSVATALFAERGFYGTSIAQISTELGLSKQALLHHFGSKEKLYAEVLKQISDKLMCDLEEVARDSAKSDQRTEHIFSAVFQSANKNPATTQLLVRELLDNKRRAETAQAWFLMPFLELLIDVIQHDHRVNQLSKIDALAIVYQIVGAIHYFLISAPTLSHMFGAQNYAELEQNYEAEIRALVSARLEFIAQRAR